MAIKKSAKKAIKRSQKQYERNLIYKTEMKNAIKAIRKAVKLNTLSDTGNMLKQAYSKIDKAAKIKLIHKNNAARKKSRLSKLIQKASS